MVATDWAYFAEFSSNQFDAASIWAIEDARGDHSVVFADGKFGNRAHGYTLPRHILAASIIND
jgi:hypothetical protein